MPGRGKIMLIRAKKVIVNTRSDKNKLFDKVKPRDGVGWE